MKDKENIYITFDKIEQKQLYTTISIRPILDKYPEKKIIKGTNIYYDPKLSNLLGNDIKKYLELHINSFNQIKTTLKDEQDKNICIILPFGIKENSQNILATSYVKSGLHYEKQKIQNENSYNTFAKEYIELLENNSNKDKLKKDIIAYEVHAIGIDISETENRAMHALYSLLNKMNQKNNNGKFLQGNNSYRYSGFLPKLVFAPSEYLDAYGAKKYLTARGKSEYSGEERRQALQALVNLATKHFLLVYKRIYYILNDKGKKEKRIDRIESIDTLISISTGWELLSEFEDQTLDNGKSTNEINKKIAQIGITLCPLLVDQLDTYFVMKPANYIQEIKFKLGTKASKYIYRFIDLLFVEVTQQLMKQDNKYNWIFERNYETIAKNLRMDNDIKARRKKRIRDTINKCYEIAKELEYVLDFYIELKGITRTVDRLILNPEKFYKTRQVGEQIKKIENLTA